jgi:glycosyltransferase involved in cell wall biosynthesis
MNKKTNQPNRKVDPDQHLIKKPHLVWINPGLHGAWYQPTWIEMTREIRALGWNVTLFTAGPRNLKQIYGVDVECIPKPNIYLLRQVIFHTHLLLILARRWNTIDFILFGSMTAPWLLPLRLLRRLKKKPDVLFIMDVRTVAMELKEKSSIKDRIRNAYDRMINHIVELIADGLTAITPRLADMIGISPDRLWGTWPSGVNLERFSSAIQTREWPKDGDRIQITYIGVLHYERNLMPLARAIVRANQDGMAFSLSLIGMGTEGPSLEEISRRYPEYILMQNPIPHTDIPPKLAEAHIGVLPFPDLPQFRVSSPIKLFEYMAAGLPILATRIVCHTDVIHDGKYVFWAEDASEDELLACLRGIWEKRAALQQMGRESLKAAEDWTWEKSAQKLVRALENGRESYRKLS